MKTRFLLLGAAVAMMASTAVAQENLLENGDFEAETTLIPEWDDGVQNVAEYIPGWDRKTNSDGSVADYVEGDLNNAGMDRWNAFGMIMPVTDDDVAGTGGDLMPGSSWQYFRMRRYQWNGWFDSNGLQQTVDVVPGQTYTLSCIYRVPSVGGTRDKNPANRYIRVFEGSTSGIALIDFDITPTNNPETGESEELECDWTRFEGTFVTDSETKVVVCIGMNGAGGEGDGMPANEDVRVDFDEVTLVAGTTGVDEIAADNSNLIVMGKQLYIFGAEAGTPVRIFDITGKIVYQAAAEGETMTIDLGDFGKGVFIANVGGQSKKFIL